ncbi:flagellar basal body rod protein FlgB [Zavarzinia compransoris]|uniref:Flagellar basal body rod protein FlgB n=1 Tax=Zavarzinia compransoris TaxID=1264899 RepID=A0A317DYP8_9PROT|nr:flagellar basal body rod protein FlgB [Zavarzinia compransoris]PWR19809.1 flagellar basal body rod protein FlgB [Zavarzinia compransoris]TDP45086.1 flagellar basal-body rod protein FlgB [Zavarzinia compransoris]
MDLDRIPLIGMLVRRMEFLGARQRVIAQNVANADTPGYKPRDVTEDSFARHVAREMGPGQSSSAPSSPSALQATNAAHLSGTLAERGAATRRSERQDDYETSPSGNAVVLEEEMARLADNQMNYDTITGIYRKQVQMLKTALRGPGSSA